MNNGTILGIDPGNKQSGVVLWSTTPVSNKILYQGNISNDDVLGLIQENEFRVDVLACEWIQSFGMAVGATVFETCLWAGRFVERAGACGISSRLVPRGVIKRHHCGSPHAKDGNIAQAIRDKYGEKGTKADPGFFYGVSKHVWQACAVAAYVAEGGRDPKELIYPYIVE
jgi:hypothetical protein